ncbi:Protoporphyrinogen oxidase [Planctomycetes bacterium MalM25]|nr:Protoporphyrinogen oxidase [Planctomycetes bacterium MalM25]
MPDSPPQRRVAILGGGITGLAAALRLEESGVAVDWRLLEASPRVGGVLETVRDRDCLIELSADNFLTRDPWATDLCRRVGLEEELLPTDPARRRALVVSNGRIRRVPEGFVLMSPQRAWPILASPILSPLGKARLAAEGLVPTRRDKADESVAAFARRRLGKEAFERLVQPLVAGIYTADPERLSMDATMAQFVRQEREHGSLTRAALSKRSATAERSESGARYGLFVAPRAGMQQLVDAIEARLPKERIATNASVQTIERDADGAWRLAGEGGEDRGVYDELIVTLPAAPAAQALRTADTELADLLSQVEYAGCSVVCLVVEAGQVTRPIDGFGFVVPQVEGRRLIAASFASYKFPGRTPDGRVLIRAFVGGALQPELADRDDAGLVSLVREELGELVGLTGEASLTRIARWPRRMPQYHVGHLGLVQRIEARAQSLGVELAGAAYRGVGVPQCVHSGEQAAERVLERIAS